MEALTLYRVRPVDARKNNHKKCGLLLGGNSVNITLYGRNIRPENLSDMVDITNGDPFVLEGAYVLATLPDYVYFSGTADVIELINYTASAVYPFGGDLPMTATDLTDMGYSSETIDARLIFLSQIVPALTDITIYLAGNDPHGASVDVITAITILTNNGCYIDSEYTP